MIKKILIGGVFGLFIVCTLVPSVHAVELTISSPANSPGLTWDTGSQVLSSLHITSTPELSVSPKSTSNILTDVISAQTPTVTPTPPQIPQVEIALAAVEVTPSPTPTPIATATQQQQSSNPGGLNADVLFNMVNNYRASQNLPAFQKNDQVCAVAESRAPQVGNEVATGTMHAGLAAMNLPYWNTENIISMNSEQAAFNWWLNDPIHHAAIISNNTYSCVACSGNNCAEEFTNFQTK